MSDEPKVKRKPMSAEHRANMSAAARKRKPPSAETRAKISAKARKRCRRRPGRVLNAAWRDVAGYDDVLD